MTSRQARRERREIERQAKKLELKKSRQPGFVPQTILVGAGSTPPALPETPLQPANQIGFVSQNKPTRAEINRANARSSTGPTSPTGKSASSRNSLKHGLASGQLIIPGENPAEFESLLNDLLHDHQPANETEALLIQEMAQSHWLHQRAIRLQNSCFTEAGVDQKGLALFLRYGTTHHRAFYKALAELLRLQKERRKAEIGFVSQNSASSAIKNGFVSQNHPSTRDEAGFVSQNAPGDPPERSQNTANAA